MILEMCNTINKITTSLFAVYTDTWLTGKYYFSLRTPISMLVQVTKPNQAQWLQISDLIYSEYSNILT